MAGRSLGRARLEWKEAFVTEEVVQGKGHRGGTCGRGFGDPGCAEGVGGGPAGKQPVGEGRVRGDAA